MPRPETHWRLTQAHLRAVAVGGIALLAAVVLHRLDLLVMATPFAVIATWSLLRRPRRTPTTRAGVGRRTVREGETTRWTGTVDAVPGLEDVVGALQRSRWSELDPGSGVVVRSAAPGPRRGTRDTAEREVSERGLAERDPADLGVQVALRALRWGRHTAGPSLLSASSAWGAYRSGPVEHPGERLVVLPQPAVFDAAAPAPHPEGLVGLNRSARPGEGTEFAGIRPFQTGDRLRRIHWPVSQRTGALHVRETYADQDSHIVLVVDAFNDLGGSEGINGRASSLDITVRAAGAMAEHYLHRGERVSLLVLGAADVHRVPPASGRDHLRRLLHRLAEIRPGTDRREDEQVGRLGLGAGALVVMLSPLVSPVALRQAVTAARRGLTVAVIDTLPDDAGPVDEGVTATLAWRLRLLEREAEIRRVTEAGVPVVAWHGPGSLDRVLRELGRHGRAPRRVVR